MLITKELDLKSQSKQPNLLSNLVVLLFPSTITWRGVKICVIVFFFLIVSYSIFFVFLLLPPPPLFILDLTCIPLK